MSNPRSTYDLLTHVSDDVQGFKDFVADLKESKKTKIKCGMMHFLADEDYEVMPVRITTESNIYEGEFPLYLDTLSQNEQDMINAIIEWVEGELEDI